MLSEIIKKVICQPLMWTFITDIVFMLSKKNYGIYSSGIKMYNGRSSTQPCTIFSLELGKQTLLSHMFVM